MKNLLLMSAICLQLGRSYGYPNPRGVGAFAYQDSAGHRYGGTYGLKDGQVFSSKGNDFAVPFAPNTFYDLDDFFPDFFRNLENLLHEAFATNLENQRLAYNAAKKAYDLTSNQAGYVPNFASRFNPFGGFPGFVDFGSGPGFDMSRFGGMNSAFAAGAAGPGFTHQIASINPGNPAMPNVNVKNRFAEAPAPAKPQYYSVSSSSYASSANMNGAEVSRRGAETVVNNNGKVTKYKVHS